jgi:hypothetical protein
LLPLAIIIAIVVLLSNWKPENYGDILTIPISMISEAISFLLHIKRQYAHLAMSLLPSLFMFAGMMTKR